ncbi:disulfide bond formation protein B [Saccharospirillum mangrovi]|uniref:disulfide bond formation protein B n=1 Tax=Saccharospirillum mangrovi TaxID=2161747 RepID=UPI00130082ED|nr:disulfide bond formation protein B [Saccharospirillum mangrovi]
MIDRVVRFIGSRWYWLALVVGALALEGIALFYQHVLNEPPCLLCIHARLWVLGILLAGGLGMALRRHWWGLVAAQSVLIVSLLGLLERSWVGVQIERGLYEGACGMDPGFPAWFALDDWFPNVFQVWTMCGYSPIMPFGLTMVETLTYGSVLALLVSALGMIALLLRRT